MTALAIKGIGAILSLALLFNMTITRMPQTRIVGVEHKKDYLVYRVEFKENGEKIPAKVTFKEPDSFEITYEKKGGDIKFNYKKHGDKPLPADERRIRDSIVQEVERHSRGWLQEAYGSLKNLLTDFRKTLMKKPVR